MKRRGFYVFLVLLFLGVTAVCALFVIKPGASIFYYKIPIDSQAIQPDFGHSYRYELNTTPNLFRLTKLLIFEDGSQLHPDVGDVVIETGNGAYTLGEPDQGSIYVYFSASDNSDPSTNGKKYILYLPYSFVSRTLGIIYLLILSPLLAWFLYFAFVESTQRKILFQSPSGIFKVLDLFFNRISSGLQADTGTFSQRINARGLYWKRLFAVIVMAAFLYIFMEWVFFTTKTSFMSIMPVFSKLELFLVTGLFFALLCLVVLAVYILLDLLFIFIHRQHLTRYLGALIPAVVLSMLALLMIDNFTYTIFKFGISTSAGWRRWAYLLLFLILVVLIFVQLIHTLGLQSTSTLKRKASNRLLYFSLGILAVSVILAFTQFDFHRLSSSSAASSPEAVRRPNILLLGSDGVSADHMSVYGYNRDTTPNLRQLAQSSLVAENAFPNSNKSAGSVVSMMTGKLPSTTRVGFSYDILTGLDAYQHLPGILKNEGYKTVEFGVRYYVDSYSFNLQNGFDWVNTRTQSESMLGSLVRKVGFDNPAYFLDLLTERISDRLLHIFYFRTMQNAISLVEEPADDQSDQSKIDQVLSLFDSTQQPLFIHVHLMGTHGGEFSPLLREFSKGEEQDKSWMDDFYDDTILSFDYYVGEVIDHLNRIDKYNDTILIIYTDHEPQWEVTGRIPLIFHFPNGQYAGKIIPNVQNLDIAPTILDYLGLAKPNWMGGESLISSTLDSHRLIFSLGTIEPHKYTATGAAYLDPELKNPPFYQFGFISVIDCQNWYALDLKTLIFTSGEVPNYPSPCSADSLPTNAAILKAMADQLASDRFDVSSFNKIKTSGP